MHNFRSWNPIGHYPHFLFHIGSTWYSLFITKNSANPLLQRHDIIKRNVVWSNFETVNYLQHGVGQMCFSWWCKIFCGNFVNVPWCPRAPWRTDWQSQLPNKFNSCFLSGYGWFFFWLSESLPINICYFLQWEKPLHWFTYFQVFFFFSLNNKHLFLGVLKA